MSDPSVPEPTPEQSLGEPSAAPERIAPALVASLFVQHGDELKRFLYGVLRNNEHVNDTLQVTFVKAIEQGHTARQESLKGWLFRVAYHEAIVVRRKQGVHQRATDALANSEQRTSIAPEVPLLRWEDVTRVREALAQLPPDQRRVVELRIYEQQKFVEIAAELKLPLGTVLTRMQLALKKLRGMLDSKED
ncbi:MAG: RNA polymerase sigma factor [Planctomycetes bacterium]|nr:RNA polymerase sigma factor [Planctomycetota bacterium]